MKVLHIITGLNTGGAERALYNLLSGGLSERFDCKVLSLGGEGTMSAPIRALGVPVVSLGMTPWLIRPRAFLRLSTYVKEFRPDVIQGWMYHGNLASSFAAKMASNDPVLTWNIRQTLYSLKHEKLLTRQIVRAGRALSRHPDAIIYNSHLSRDQHESFGFSAEQSSVIPNGFDVNNLRPNLEKAAIIRQEFGFDPDSTIIGHVARFHPMKDHTKFLNAAIEVAKRKPLARFLLVGRNVTPENQSLTSLVPDELMPRFVFAGERKDMTRLMQAMDVLCMSSAWGESFPNVLGEAMACGIPCVTTNVGESSKIVGDTGFVVPPSDGAELIRSLIVMLEKRTETRRQLGKTARKRIEINYNLKKIVERYAQFYNDLIDGWDYQIRIPSMSDMEVAYLIVSKTFPGLLKQVAYDKVLTGKLDSMEWQHFTFLDQVEEGEEAKSLPRLCKGVFGSKLYAWLWMLKNARHYDYVVVRHMTFDPFALIFSWFVRNRVLVHHSKEVLELRQIRRGWKGQAASWMENLSGRVATKTASALVAVTREVGSYQKEFRNLPATFPIGFFPNGVIVKDVEILKDKREHNQVVMGFMCGSFTAWHGLDRLLASLLDYFKNDFKVPVRLDLIGNLSDQQIAQVARVNAVSPQQSVFIHGRLGHQDYKKVFEKCHIGIASLAMDRIELREGATLKVREMLAMGLPIYSGHVDTALPEDFPYYLKGNVSIHQIIEFVKDVGFVERETVRTAATPYIDKKIWVENLGEFLRKLSVKT